MAELGNRELAKTRMCPDMSFGPSMVSSPFFLLLLNFFIVYLGFDI